MDAETLAIAVCAARLDPLMSADGFVAALERYGAACRREAIWGEDFAPSALSLLRVKHIDLTRKSEAEIGALRGMLEDALETIDEWKSASGLIDSGGDPSGIEPHHLMADLQKWETEVGRLKEALANSTTSLAHADACIEQGDGPGAQQELRTLATHIDEVLEGNVSHLVGESY